MDSPLKISDVSLLCKIGEGAFGEVWIAKDLVGQFQAAKIIPTGGDTQSLVSDKEWKGLENYQQLSRSHPELLTIYRIGKDDGFIFYLMQLADPIAPNWQESGGNYEPKTLKQVISQCRRLNKDDCLEYAIHLATGLKLFHQQGLIHRDIKPSNIVFVDDKPKLADIGLVRSIHDDVSFAGTEGYIAPEGARTVQSDFYSLGMVFYQMLTGDPVSSFPKLPIPESGSKQDQKWILEFNTIISKCTSPLPADRYRTAEEIVDDLCHLQKGASVRTRDRARRLSKRMGITAIAGLIVLFGFKMLNSTDTNALPPTTTVLNDDFEGDSVNTELWRMNQPFPLSKVTQAKGNLNLTSRGQIISQKDFAPNVELGGSFILKNLSDVIKICLRTTGQYVDERFAELNGIRIEFFAEGHVSVTPMGIKALVDMPLGEPVEFRIRDLNDLLSVYIGSDENPIIQVSSPLRAGSKIGIYNREFPSFEARLENIQLSEFQTAEPPSEKRISVTGLSDDFDAANINTNLWEINQPWTDSVALADNGSLILENGAAILSRYETLAPFSIAGRFKFTGNPEDSFKVLFRFNDRIDANSQSEFWAVQFGIFGKNHEKGFGNINLSGTGHTAALASYVIDQNEWINFLINDDGKLMRVYLNQSDTPTVMMESQETYGNRIGLQNRHGNAAGSMISAGSKVEVDFLEVKTTKGVDRLVNNPNQ